MSTKRRLPDAAACLRAVRRRIESQDLLGETSCVVLALSGGKDSVCLFHILRELLPECGVRLVCAHVHHGLRGRSADRDERFCAALCARYGVEYRAFFCDVKSYASERRLSTEDAARALRYEALLNFAKEREALLATAHTLSDQAETVLLQITRGGGLGAARGIEPVRADGVIRPLLSLTSADVLRFCRSGKHAFVRDHTNRSVRYLRNFYRLRVLPLMRRRNPAVDACLARFSETAGAEHRAFLSLAREQLERVGLSCEKARNALGPMIALARDEDRRPVLYVLFSGMLKAAGGDVVLTKQRFDTLCEALVAPPSPGALIQVGRGVGFLLEQDTLACVREAPSDGTDAVGRPVNEGEFTFGENGFLSKRGVLTPPCTKINKIHTSAYLNCDKIVGKLSVRTRRAADSYAVCARERLVKDLFSMRRYPLALRSDFPLICDDVGIVWIPGELAADRVRARAGDAACFLELTSGSVYEELCKRRHYE